MKKILNWLLFLCVGVIIAAEPVVSQVIATGAVSPELPSPLWIDGKHYRISENRGKKFTVLFLFSPDQTGLSELPMMISAVNNCDAQKMAFYGVGSGTVEKLQKFPGVSKLPFPVNSDNKRAAEIMFLREYDRLPMAVVIDKEGRVNWRGRTVMVPGVIRQLISGKFNLQEKIHAEQFSADVMAAIRANDFEKALKIVRKEWDANPSNIELISMQLLLLGKHLKRPDDAFKVIAEAHKRKPHDPNIYDLEYRLINNTGRKELEKPFFKRVAAEFSTQPMIMLKFAAGELRRSAKLCDMEAVRDLLSAAWTKGKFKSDEEKARFAFEYAKIMHNFGRPDLAKSLALQASRLFKNQRERDAAMEAMIFYQKVQNVSTTLK